MLGETAMALVDTRLVAGLGAGALGGVGVAATLLYLNYAMIFGAMRGVKVRASYALGQGTAHLAVRYAQAGALVAVAMGCFVWLVGRDATWALRGLGVDPATVPHARAFLEARTWGAPAICALSALTQLRQGVGDARTPMLVGLLGNLVNAPLAYALIYGRWGLPALGVAGAGYATALAEWVQAGTLFVVVYREARAHLADAAAKLSLRAALREVLAIGGPTGLQFGLEMLAFTTFTAILGAIGASEIAAHQVAMAVIRASFLPGLAVAEAGSVLVGRALGRRDLAEADRVTRAALALAVGFMTLCGLGFAVGGGVIARAFTSDAAVVRIATRLLLVAAVFQAMDAATIVLRSALRGAKDVRAVALIGISLAWVCIPGAAYLLGRVAGLGALGGWIGFVAETAAAAALLWWRWTRGAWREQYAPRAPLAAESPGLAPAAA